MDDCTESEVQNGLGDQCASRIFRLHKKSEDTSFHHKCAILFLIIYLKHIHLKMYASELAKVLNTINSNLANKIYNLLVHAVN
jgi:hypothetical protein